MRVLIASAYTNIRGPRIIATDRQAPRIYPRMIRLCSRFDSVLFTPKMPAIPSYGNYSSLHKSIFRNVLVPADGTTATTVRNGDFGTSPFFEQLSNKPPLSCVYLCGRSDVEHTIACREIRRRDVGGSPPSEARASRIAPRVSHRARGAHEHAAGIGNCEREERAWPLKETRPCDTHNRPILDIVYLAPRSEP